MTNAEARRLQRDIVNMLDAPFRQPRHHGIHPSVTPPPALGDRVTVTMPGGTQAPGVIEARLYGSATPFECRVDGRLVYVAADDLEAV